MINQFFYFVSIFIDIISILIYIHTRIRCVLLKTGIRRVVLKEVVLIELVLNYAYIKWIVLNDVVLVESVLNNVVLN